MNLQLESKLALVSGSTAGIGFAIAKSLADEGARVIINGRTETRVRQAIASIRALKPKAVILDIRMPGGSGINVLQAIKRERYRCKTVPRMSAFVKDEISRTLGIVRSLAREKADRAVQRQAHQERVQKTLVVRQEQSPAYRTGGVGRT